MALIDPLRRETRLALHSIVRNRAFSVIAIITLALGLSATTSIFALLDAVVLRPLPYADPEQLVWVDHPVPGVRPDARWRMSPSGYFHVRDQNRSFTDIGAFVPTTYNLSSDGRPERARGAVATASLFNTLRLRPHLGRLIREQENLPNATPVAVLGYDFWIRRFGGDPSIVGKTIEIETRPTEVVGVLARGANLPRDQIDVWMPITLDRDARPMNSHYLEVVARLEPEVTAAAATQDLVRLVARFPDLFPTAYSPRFIRESRFAVAVEPLRDYIVGGIAKVLWTLLAAVGLVLVIACANVTNLVLVRTETRRRELAIRSALGGDRAQLAWHYITESVVLTVIAGAAAVGLAHASLRLLVSIAPESIPRLAGLSLGWRGIAFCAVVSLVLGVIFGLLPLSRATADVAALRESGRGLTSSRRQHAIRNGLVVGQIALALVLLSAGGLLVQSFRHLRSVRSGFEPRGVLTFELSVSNAKYRTYEATNAFYRELLARLGALPGVQSVGAATVVPLDGVIACSGVLLEVKPANPDKQTCVPMVAATPGYFETLGIPVTGRAPTWNDVDAANGGVVITRTLADRLWPNEDPIGKGLNGGSDGLPFYRVVGVAGDVRATGLDKPPTEIVFYPTAPIAGGSLWGPYRALSVVIRVRSGPPETLVAAARRVLTELDPAVPLANPRSMETVLARSDSVARVSFTMMLISLAAGMALTLSIIGIYGVISYIVSRRRAEIGIRMALGARVTEVGAMVVSQSMRLAGLGVVIGLVAAVAGTRTLRALLYGVSPLDPLILGGVAALLILLAALASFPPARRAATVNPVEALRSE